MSEGVARDSKADHATLSEVHAAAQRGAHTEAAVMAAAALADGLEHPLLLNVVALNFEMQGRVAEAEQLLRRAVAIAPSDVGSRNALGLGLLGSTDLTKRWRNSTRLSLWTPPCRLRTRIAATLCWRSAR